MINFWFAACSPCRKEIPDLNKLVKKYQNNTSVVFLGLSTDNEDVLSKFLNEFEFNYQMIANAKSIAENFKVMVYPTNFIIDKNGIITYAHSGYNDDLHSELELAVEKALKI